MEKKSLTNVSVLVSFLVLVVAATVLITVSMGMPEPPEGPSPIEGLRAEIASLKEAVEASKAAAEKSEAECRKLAEQVGKLERDVAASIAEARMEAETVREAIKQEMRALLKRGKGGEDRGIPAWFEKMGVGGETVGKIQAHFLKNGFTDKQAKMALVGVLKVLHEMREEGDGYKMDPRLRGYLEKEAALKGKQIELVETIARRIATHLNERVKKGKAPVQPPGVPEDF